MADIIKKDEINNAKIGHKLLAYIFALWTIIKADIFDEEVEYLYDPHCAQVIAIFLVLGICDSIDGRIGNRIA
jgi:hypothetical protein